MDELVKRLRDFAVELRKAEDALLVRDAADAIEGLLSERDEVNADSWKTAFEVERDEHRWIPVAERLPEQFKPVLVYYSRNGYSGTGVAEYYHDGDTKVWRGCGFIPTHWMPLPESPKEET